MGLLVRARMVMRSTFGVLGCVSVSAVPLAVADPRPQINQRLPLSLQRLPAPRPPLPRLLPLPPRLLRLPRVLPASRRLLALLPL
jgi:hypothetical protein